MIRRRREHGLLTAMLGFGLGTATGLVVSELVGGVSRERVQGGLRRLRRSRETGEDPLVVERAVLDALRADPSARTAGLRAHSLGLGTVELVGWVTTEEERIHAEAIAQDVVGVAAVINRVLVRGEDGHPPGPDSNAVE